MPSVLEVQVTAKLNGRLLPNFPQYRRVQLDETQQFSVEQASGGGYVPIQATQISTLQALIISPTLATTIRIAGQSDAGLLLNGGGLLLILDATTSTVSVDNSSGGTVLLEGLAGGT